MKRFNRKRIEKMRDTNMTIDKRGLIEEDEINCYIMVMDDAYVIFICENH